jgi:hypothetical protein
VKAHWAPLVIGPTPVRGLIEFQRADCGHPYETGNCPNCVEFADRRQLTDALRTITDDGRETARIGQTVLDEADLRTLFEYLDRYDIALVRRQQNARLSWLRSWVYARIPEGPPELSWLDEESR